jgi:hypothetical protein
MATTVTGTPAAISLIDTEGMYLFFSLICVSCDHVFFMTKADRVVILMLDIMKINQNTFPMIHMISITQMYLVIINQFFHINIVLSQIRSTLIY